MFFSDKDDDFLMNQNDVDSMINKIERIQGVQIIAGYSQEKIKER